MGKYIMINISAVSTNPRGIWKYQKTSKTLSRRYWGRSGSLAMKKKKLIKKG